MTTAETLAYRREQAALAAARRAAVREAHATVRAGWGGARKGAGRPKLDTETVRLNLRRDTVAALRAAAARPSKVAGRILRAGLGLKPTE